MNFVLVLLLLRVLFLLTLLCLLLFRLDIVDVVLIAFGIRGFYELCPECKLRVFCRFFRGKSALTRLSKVYAADRMLA